MLRLEIAKQLAKGNPKFVALNPGQGGGSATVDLSKTDMNQLLQQLGVVEGLAGTPQRATGQAQQQPEAAGSTENAGEGSTQP
jgi:hypothetical protein